MKYNKKTLLGTLILCVFILTAILSPAMATVNSKAGNTTTSQPKDVAPGAPSWISQPPEYFSPTPVLKTDMTIKPNFSITVPLFSQNDPSWSGNLMHPCLETIGSIGCALTSTAMVFKYFGVSTDPAQLNSCVYTDCSWPWPTSCASGKVKMQNVWNSNSNTDSNFYYYLRYSLYVDHNPPILQIQKPSGLHFVVVVAYANTGTKADDFTINDPWTGGTRSLGDYLDYGDYGTIIHEYAHS